MGILYLINIENYSKMNLKLIEKQIGRVILEKETPNGKVLYTQDGKYFVARRDPVLSERSAIKLISQYGIIPVILVGDSYILEKYVNFNPKQLKLEDRGKLLGLIHSNNLGGKPLVHGDFGISNTTYFNDAPKCLDYEFTHFGDVYRDIGRVILRNCGSVGEMVHFFDNYPSGIPSPDKLKDGLSSFCDWQNLLRIRKNLEFPEVPLIRKEQVKDSRKNIEAIFKSFKNIQIKKWKEKK